MSEEHSVQNYLTKELKISKFEGFMTVCYKPTVRI